MPKFPQRRPHNLNGGRPKKENKKITVSIVMPPEMASSLRSQATEENVSLSEIVTRIIGGEEAPQGRKDNENGTVPNNGRSGS